MKIFHDSQSLTDWINYVNWPDGELFLASRLKVEGETGKELIHLLGTSSGQEFAHSSQPTLLH